MNANPMINPNIQMLLQLMQRGPNAAQHQPPAVQQFLPGYLERPGRAPQSAPAQQPPPAATQPPPAVPETPSNALTQLPDIVPAAEEPAEEPSSYRSLVSHMGQGAQDAYDEAQSQMAELQRALSERRDTAGQFREGREAIDAQRPERFTTMSEDQRKALNDEFYDSLIAASSRPGSSFGMALGESLQARGARRRENVDRNEARWERDRDRQMREMVQGLQLEAGDDDATMQRKIQQMQMLQGMVSGRVAAAAEGERLDQATQTEARRVEELRQARLREDKRHEQTLADRQADRDLRSNLATQMTWQNSVDKDGKPITVPVLFHPVTGVEIPLNPDGSIVSMPRDLPASQIARLERQNQAARHVTQIMELARVGAFGEGETVGPEEAMRISQLLTDENPAYDFKGRLDAAFGQNRQRVYQELLDYARQNTGTPRRQ